MIVEVVGCLISTLALFCVYTTEERGCDWSLPTQKLTNRCPRNKDEWTRRANHFNCSSYPQNCTTHSLFSYHCVPNAWQNASVEVCATTSKIVGYKCTEFNVGGRMVQEHNKGTCSSCDFSYSSTEAYKYRECYSYEKDQSTERKITTEKVNVKVTVISKNESSKCNGLECPVAGPNVYVKSVAAISTVILSLVVMVLIMWICKRTDGNTRKDTGKKVECHDVEGSSETTMVEKVLLHHTDELDETKMGFSEDVFHGGYFSSNGKTPAIPEHDVNTSFSTLHEPEYPDYTELQIRVLSFSAFPLTEKTEDLAKAGFFYEGYDLCTKCFQCGCKKQNWKPDDNALLEHLGLDSNCSFALSIKKAKESEYNNE